MKNEISRITKGNKTLIITNTAPAQFVQAATKVWTEEEAERLAKEGVTNNG